MREGNKGRGRREKRTWSEKGEIKLWGEREGEGEGEELDKDEGRGQEEGKEGSGSDCWRKK